MHVFRLVSCQQQLQLHTMSSAAYIWPTIPLHIRLYETPQPAVIIGFTGMSKLAIPLVLYHLDSLCSSAHSLSAKIEVLHHFVSIFVLLLQVVQSLNKAALYFLENPL
jgi:hypothetical protein